MKKILSYAFKVVMGISLLLVAAACYDKLSLAFGRNSFFDFILFFVYLALCFWVGWKLYEAQQ